MIRVLLADDQVLVRAGFRLLLESADDIAVVAEAATGGEAVALTREHAPDGPGGPAAGPHVRCGACFGGGRRGVWRAGGPAGARGAD